MFERYPFFGLQITATNQQRSIFTSNTSGSNFLTRTTATTSLAHKTNVATTTTTASTLSTTSNYCSNSSTATTTSTTTNNPLDPISINPSPQAF